MAIFSIPLIAAPQTFTITLVGVTYTMSLAYQNVDQGGWTLSIADANGNPIITGIPLVTGADLLAQYAYLGIGGSLYVQTSSDPDAVPTFAGLGTSSLLLFVTPS